MNQFALWVLVLLISGGSSWAQEASKDVRKAIQMTQEMLKDPAERKKAIGTSPQGHAADQKVHELAGSKENEQAIYDLAASVFGTMMEQTDGDEEKMQKLLEEGMKNPEAFAKKWSPEELQKLHDLGKKIQSQTPTN